MTLEEARSLKLGQSKVMRNGHTATCTAYRGARDADFTFEDGSVTTGKAWAQFDKGTLKPPSVKRRNPIRVNQAREKYVGTQKTCKNGLTATCVAYQNAGDITVQWPDGEIREHVRLKSFLSGDVKKEGAPAKTRKAKDANIGRRNTANNGMGMEITGYQDSRHLAVRFEDGTTVGDIRSGDFNNGNVTHPLYPSRKGKAYGKKIRIGCVDRGQMAYNCRLANYYCACAKCGLEDIMDWREIHTHNMAHSIPRETLAYEGAVILDTPLQEPKGA